ncbi:MAG: guanylate kinase, partial [Chloroflexota bacterium]
GLLFVLSGPSGVGKDTVLESLKQRGLPIHFTVTVTTRATRPGEIHGINYFFASAEEFSGMRDGGQLLEWALVHGNHYGTPRQQVREALAGGRDVFLKIDVQGAAQVRRAVPEAVLIFLAPPNVEQLVDRLITRGTESEGERSLRLHDAQRELAEVVNYDYVVVNHNDRVEDTVDQIIAIVVAEHCRVKPRHIKV